MADRTEQSAPIRRTRVSGRPKCPAWLDREAKLCWRRVVDTLVADGRIDTLDGNVLTRYCVAWSRWRAASETIKREGETRVIYTEPMPAKGWPKGSNPTIRDIYPQPEVKIVRQLEDVLIRIEVQLGMTPKSRLDIDAKSKSPKVGRGGGARVTEPRKSKSAKDRFASGGF